MQNLSMTLQLAIGQDSYCQMKFWHLCILPMYQSMNSTEETELVWWSITLLALYMLVKFDRQYDSLQCNTWVLLADPHLTSPHISYDHLSGLLFLQFNFVLFFFLWNFEGSDMDTDMQKFQLDITEIRILIVTWNFGISVSNQSTSLWMQRR